MDISPKDAIREIESLSNDQEKLSVLICFVRDLLEEHAALKQKVDSMESALRQKEVFDEEVSKTITSIVAKFEQLDNALITMSKIDIKNVELIHDLQKQVMKILENLRSTISQEFL